MFINRSPRIWRGAPVTCLLAAVLISATACDVPDEDAPTDTLEEGLAGPPLPHVAVIHDVTVFNRKVATAMYTRLPGGTLAWRGDNDAKWTDTGYPIASDVAAANGLAQESALAYRQSDNAIWVSWGDGSHGLSLGTPAGHTFVGHPAIAYQHIVALRFWYDPPVNRDVWRVFGRDEAGGLWERDCAGAAPSPTGTWTRVNTPALRSDPVALTGLTNRLDLFFVAGDASQIDTVYQASWSFNLAYGVWERGDYQGAWSLGQPTAGVATDWMSAARTNGTARDMTVTVATRDNQESFIHYTSASKSWSAWTGFTCGKAIDDGLPCTSDFCDPITNTIVSTPVAAGTTCSLFGSCNEMGACDTTGSCAAIFAPAGGVCAPVELALGTPLATAYIQDPVSGQFLIDLVGTAPTDQGEGYLTVALTDFDPHGRVSFRILSALDNGLITSDDNASDGASVTRHIPVEPGARLIVELSSFVYSGAKASRFTATMTFTPLVDKYEPNNSAAAASRIQLGQPVRALMVAGYDTSTRPVDPATAAWDDWYKIEIPTGAQTLSVQITDLPASLGLNAEIWSLDRTESLGSKTVNFHGATATTFTSSRPISSGAYLRIWSDPPTKSEIVSRFQTVPENFTQPYTLLVTGS